MFHWSMETVSHKGTCMPPLLSDWDILSPAWTAAGDEEYPKSRQSSQIGCQGRPFHSYPGNIHIPDTKLVDWLMAAEVLPKCLCQNDDLDKSHVCGMWACRTLSKLYSLSWWHGNVRSSGWKYSPISDISNMATVTENTAAGFLPWLKPNQPQMMLRLKKEFYLV